MVDTDRPIEIASQSAGRGEARKVDQVVHELGRYGVVVGALQETKWFGREVYDVNDSVVLTSGRSTPAQIRERQSRGVKEWHWCFEV